MVLDAHFGGIDTCTLLSPRALSLVFAVFGVCFVWCLLRVVSADWGRMRGHTRSRIYLYKYIYMVCVCGHVGVAHYWCSTSASKHSLSRGGMAGNARLARHPVTSTRQGSLYPHPSFTALAFGERSATRRTHPPKVAPICQTLPPLLISFMYFHFCHCWARGGGAQPGVSLVPCCVCVACCAAWR